MSVEQIAVNGFNVPPAPGQPAMQPPNAQPGFAPQAPAAPQGFTQAQVNEQIAAALKAAQPQAPAAPVPQAPQHNFTLEDAGNDSVLTSLTDVFTSVGSGLDLDRAIGNALTYGNPGLIDVAYIAEKGGAHAAQLQNLAKAIVERVQAQAADTSSAVFDTAGGKDNWTAAAAAFDQNAPQHLKQVIAQMLDSGNTEAIKSAAKSVVDYARQGGLISTPGALLQSGAAQLGAAQAMSKAEYQAEHFKLNPNSKTYLQDRSNLQARRALGMKLGK